MSQEEQQQQQQQEFREIDPAYERVVNEIVQDNTNVYGRKYKPRNEEPNMFQMLSWQAKDSEKADYKTDNPSIVHAHGYQKYKARINRTEDPYYSESRDQYRKYHHDKQTGAVLPEFDLDQLELLRQEQEQIPQRQGLPIAEQRVAPEVPQPVQQQLELKDVQNKLVCNQTRNGKKQNPTSTKPSGVFYYKDEEEEEAIRVKQQAEEQAAQELEDAEQLALQEENGEYHRPMPTTDLKKVKSKLLSSKKTAKKLDPVYEKERLDRRKQRIKDMEGKTRWLPNTAFTTYFGKPAFENYGMGNVQPAVGGMVYGQYLLSHNVNPHKGQKVPQFPQSHTNALDFAERLPDQEPQPPRKCKDEYRESQHQVDVLLHRSPLVAQPNTRQNLTIIKPDLTNTLRFASEENSPERSETDSIRRKKLLAQNKTFKRVTNKSGSKAQSQKNVQIQDTKKQQNDAKSVASSQQQKSVQGSQTQKQRPQTAQPKQKSKKVSDQQQQQEKSQEIGEYERQNFMEEKKRKQQKANRLALKVTEVIPIVEQNDSDAQKIHTQQVQQQVVAQQFDEMDPPEGYLQQVQEYELNPQNYKNIPPQWMKRIPFAGKKLEQNQPFSINQ